MNPRSATIATIVAAAALLMSTPLPAQVTTYVGSARKTAPDSVKTPVLAAKARADSVARMSLTDMKAWVDSAAGGSAKVANVSDTLMVATNPALSPQPTATAHTTTTFSNGAIAPNTATPLPTLLVGGFASIAAGLFLLGLRRRRT